MLRKIRGVLRNKKGQGMTEYVILVAMIAVACIVVVKLFGNQIYNLFSTSTQVVGTGTAGTVTAVDSDPGKGLGTYNEP